MLGVSRSDHPLNWHPKLDLLNEGDRALARPEIKSERQSTLTRPIVDDDSDKANARLAGHMVSVTLRCLCYVSTYYSKWLERTKPRQQLADSFMSLHRGLLSTVSAVLLNWALHRTICGNRRKDTGPRLKPQLVLLAGHPYYNGSSATNQLTRAVQTSPAFQEQAADPGCIC